MIKKLLLIMTLMFAVQSASMACSAMGANKHVGQVTSIDTEAGTFTIMDMQLQKPLTFTASSAVLQQVGKQNGRIVVIFEQKDNQLVATGIEI